MRGRKIFFLNLILSIFILIEFSENNFDKQNILKFGVF